MVCFRSRRPKQSHKEGQGRQGPQCIRTEDHWNFMKFDAMCRATTQNQKFKLLSTETLHVVPAKLKDLEILETMHCTISFFRWGLDISIILDALDFAFAVCQASSAMCWRSLAFIRLWWSTQPFRCASHASQRIEILALPRWKWNWISIQYNSKAPANGNTNNSGVEVAFAFARLVLKYLVPVPWCALAFFPPAQHARLSHSKGMRCKRGRHAEARKHRKCPWENKLKEAKHSQMFNKTRPPSTWTKRVWHSIASDSQYS